MNEKNGPIHLYSLRQRQAHHVGEMGVASHYLERVVVVVAVAVAEVVLEVQYRGVKAGNNQSSIALSLLVW